MYQADGFIDERLDARVLILEPAGDLLERFDVVFRTEEVDTGLEEGCAVHHELFGRSEKVLFQSEGLMDSMGPVICGQSINEAERVFQGHAAPFISRTCPELFVEEVTTLRGCPGCSVDGRLDASELFEYLYSGSDFDVVLGVVIKSRLGGNGS